MPRRIYKKAFCLLVLLFWPFFIYAAVSQVVFTTEPQTVSPGAISSTITIQLQNSSGNSSPATETVDVEFLSSSASGEFLSPSSENPVTKTISTGSANKNFRYRDSRAGNFVLIVNAKGRVSGTIWSKSQNITISNTASSTATTTEETTSPPAGTNSSSSSSDSLVSANYSAEPVSSNKVTAAFALSAGRDRLGAVGSPLEFKAVTDLSYTRNSIFKWNLGDGSEGVGETLVHAYEYPGEYVVVLNVSTTGSQAIARANVKIISPDIVIVSANSERIEVKNNSKNEVSLFGRVLVAGGKTFVFPQDTIIKAGQALSFGSKVTGLQPAALTDVGILVIGNTEQSKIVAKVEEEKSKEIARLNGQLESDLVALEAQLAAKYSDESTVVPHLAVKPPSGQAEVNVEALLPQKEAVLPELETSVVSEQQTAVAVKSGWFAMIKRFFLRTK